VDYSSEDYVKVALYMLVKSSGGPIEREQPINIPSARGYSLREVLVGEPLIH
jgi:hypothetical protein